MAVHVYLAITGSTKQSHASIECLNANLVHSCCSPNDEHPSAHIPKNTCAQRSRVFLTRVIHPVQKPHLADAAPCAAQLGPGKWTQTAACLIIGDEVLNGKTHDTNSNFMAKQLFDLGIDMRRVEVIPDEEEDVRNASCRKNCDQSYFPVCLDY